MLVFLSVKPHDGVIRSRELLLMFYQLESRQATFNVTRRTIPRRVAGGVRRGSALTAAP